MPKSQAKDKSKKKPETKEIEIKICLLGDFNIDKTSITSLFWKKSFIENYLNTIENAYQ